MSVICERAIAVGDIVNHVRVKSSSVLITRCFKSCMLHACARARAALFYITAVGAGVGLAAAAKSNLGVKNLRTISRRRRHRCQKVRPLLI